MPRLGTAAGCKSDPREIEKASKEKVKKLSPIQEMSNEEWSSPEAEAPMQSLIIRGRRLDTTSLSGSRPGSSGRVGGAETGEGGAPGLTRICKAPGNGNGGGRGGRHEDFVSRGMAATSGTSSTEIPPNEPRAVLPVAAAGAAAMMRQPDRQLQLQKKKKKQQQHGSSSGLGKRVSNPPKRLLSPILGPTGDDSSHSDEDSIPSPSIPPSGRATGTNATEVLGNITCSNIIAAAQGGGRGIGRGGGEGSVRTGRDCAKGSGGRRRSRSCPSTGNRTISGGDRSIRSGVDVGPAQATNETSKEPTAAMPCQVHFDIPVELPSHAVAGRPLRMHVPLEFELPPGARPGMTVAVRVAALLAPNTPTPLVLTGEVLPLPRDTEPESERGVALQPKSGRRRGLGTTVRAQSNDGCGKKIINVSKNPKSNASGRVVGEDGRITEPGPYDYVGGETGTGSTNFHGNTFFKNLANSLIPYYKAQTHGSKTYLPHALTQEIMFRRGGAFLTKVADRHYEVHENQYDKMTDSAQYALRRNI